MSERPRRRASLATSATSSASCRHWRRTDPPSRWAGPCWVAHRDDLGCPADSPWHPGHRADQREPVSTSDDSPNTTNARCPSAHGRVGKPCRRRPASSAKSPTVNTALGGHRTAATAGAILRRAGTYGPLGSSQISLSGLSTASSCSQQNTWNRTLPTEKVPQCATGSSSMSVRQAA